jgi:hypothetical protein
MCDETQPQKVATRKISFSEAEYGYKLFGKVPILNIHIIIRVGSVLDSFVLCRILCEQQSNGHQGADVSAGVHCPSRQWGVLVGLLVERGQNRWIKLAFGFYHMQEIQTPQQLTRKSRPAGHRRGRRQDSRVERSWWDSEKNWIVFRTIPSATMPFGLTWDVGFLRTRSGMLMSAQVVSSYSAGAGAPFVKY